MMMQQQPVAVQAIKQWIEVGPIWDNNDAHAKAGNWVASNPGWRFTGEWKTTIPNQMSVIEVTNC